MPVRHFLSPILRRLCITSASGLHSSDTNLAVVAAVQVDNIDDDEERVVKRDRRPKLQKQSKICQSTPEAPLIDQGELTNRYQHKQDEVAPLINEGDEGPSSSRIELHEVWKSNNSDKEMLSKDEARRRMLSWRKTTKLRKTSSNISSSSELATQRLSSTKSQSARSFKVIGEKRAAAGPVRQNTTK